MAGKTSNNMVVAVACLVALLQISSSAATNYTVGGSSGWQAISYTSWLSGKSFKVGDSLVFNNQGTHTVTQVTESDYNSCSSSNPISQETTSTTTIALSKAGTFYYICSIPGHCQLGQKLAVVVSAASSSSPTPSTSPTTPSSDSPPSSTTPTTASPPPPPASSDAVAAASGLAMPFLLMAAVFFL